MSRNSELFEKAKRFIPGGVNSPVRAFKTVGGIPPFIKRGKGCKIWDEDGNEYIDYVASWGPLILGHSDDEINDAAIEAIRNGSSFGAPTANEVTFAEKLCNHFDSIEMIRVVNSGTEATMASIRLARGFTERNKIVKMAGCYHGCVEALLVEAGSGIATFAIPGSPGITKGTTGDTLVVPYNDMDAVNKVFEAHGPDIAAIIVEPVPGNMGVMIPDKGYLEFLRKVTQNYGSLLIFDEVMSGFRVDHVGAQRKYNVKPDLTCLGKVIGGGFPVGAFGGRRDIMTLIAPSGPVYQAGTLSGNPVAISAGLATLSKLTEEIFNKIEQQAEILARGFREIASEAQVPLTVNRQGTMMTMFFTDKPVRCYKDAQNTETEKYNRYFKNMLSRGIALAPSAYEAGFVGLAHDDEVIEKTLKAHKESLWALRSNI